MPQNKDNSNIDPIVLAAMVEDPDETEEEKKLREEMLGTDETVPGKGTPSSDEDDEEDQDEDEDDDDKGSKKPKSDDTEDEDEDQDDPAKPKPKKPVEAEDEPDNPDDKEEDEDEEPKKTRKQRRQERNEDFIASIRKDNVRNTTRPDLPNYQPVDYEKQPLDEDGNPREYKPEELARDREMVGAVAFAQGATQVREAAEQDAFWRDLGSEAKILAYDPKLNFLSETTPDGKKNQNFDPDKTAEINEMYLQLCGAEYYQARDRQNRPLFNQNTGQPVMMIKVGRTDLSYEKFARKYVDRMQSWAEDFADDRVEETKDNLTKQRKNQGIRPTGGKRKTLGALQPGDISRMSDEELEKNEDAIDAQIDAMLGI